MNKPDGNPETHAALFQKRQIRRAIHNDEWWFAIVDVVAVLTDAADPSDYLKKMRKRDPDLSEAFKGGGSICPPLLWSSPRLAARRKSSVGISKVSFA